MSEWTGGRPQRPRAMVLLTLLRDCLGGSMVGPTSRYQIDAYACGSAAGG